MDKKTLNSLCGNYEKLARAIAGRHDITVVPSTKCATDGRTIYFPANADGMSKATREVLAGMNDHEVGHIKEEDKHKLAGKKTPMEYLREAETKKECYLMNVYEDIRMETFQALELVGVAENLKKLSLHSTRLVADRVSAPGFDNFWYALGCAIIHTTRGHDIDWLPAGYRPYMDAIADEIAESNDTSKTVWAEDSWNLVQRTLAKLNEVAEEVKEEWEKRNEEGEEGEETEEGETEEGEEEGDADGGSGSESDEDGDDADGEGSDGSEDGEGEEDGEDGEGSEGSEGEDGEDGEDGEGEDGEGSEGDANDDKGKSGFEGDETGEGDDAEGDADGEGSEGDGKESKHDGMSDEDLEAAKDLADGEKEDAQNEDAMDEVRNEINDEAEETRTRSRDYSASPEALAGDRWIKPTGNKVDYQRAKEVVAKQIRGMKGKLLNLIRTQAESSMIGDQDQGDLDDDALYSVRLGNKRVYTKTVDGTVLDTAVSILIDQSGSMGDGSSSDWACRAYYAKLMTIALAETFNALNVPFEVIGFHNDFSYRGGRGRNCRQQSFEFQIYKEFHEKHARVKDRLSAITGHQDNADGEAVLEVAKRLAARDEKRKIMFVLSDGQPAAGGTTSHLLKKNLKETVDRVTKAGIEVIGIGAQTNSVHDYYNEANGSSCIVIHDIDQLAVEVYKLMRSVMMNRKGRKGRRRAS